jgi:hypothetical protein
MVAVRKDRCAVRCPALSRPSPDIAAAGLLTSAANSKLKIKN